MKIYDELKYELTKEMSEGCPMKQPSDRIFKSMSHMVQVLGCETRKSKRVSHVKIKGDPPSPERAALSKVHPGVIFVNGDDEESDMYAVHEAVHHFLGDWSLKDEGPMMPFEFALYGMFKKKSDREKAFVFLSESFDDDCEIGYKIEREGKSYFRSKLWGKYVGAAQKYLTKKGRIRADVLSQLRSNL